MKKCKNIQPFIQQRHLLKGVVRLESFATLVKCAKRSSRLNFVSHGPPNTLRANTWSFGWFAFHSHCSQSVMISRVTWNDWNEISSNRSLTAFFTSLLRTSTRLCDDDALSAARIECHVTRQCSMCCCAIVESSWRTAARLYGGVLTNGIWLHARALASSTRRLKKPLRRSFSSVNHPSFTGRPSAQEEVSQLMNFESTSLLWRPPRDSRIEANYSPVERCACHRHDASW